MLPVHHFFFFNDTATTEIYTLSLHDALPIFGRPVRDYQQRPAASETHVDRLPPVPGPGLEDRKSTRLNSSYTVISYAVFCLKKKKKKKNNTFFKKKKKKTKKKNIK